MIVEGVDYKGLLKTDQKIIPHPMAAGLKFMDGDLLSGIRMSY